MHWVGWARAGLLILGVAWSAQLAWGIGRGRGMFSALLAAAGIMAASGAVVWLWFEMFFVW